MSLNATPKVACAKEHMCRIGTDNGVTLCSMQREGRWPLSNTTSDISIGRANFWNLGMTKLRLSKGCQVPVVLNRTWNEKSGFRVRSKSLLKWPVTVAPLMFGFNLRAMGGFLNVAVRKKLLAANRC